MVLARKGESYDKQKEDDKSFAYIYTDKWNVRADLCDRN